MRLLRTDCDIPTLETFNDERKLPKYAILSHVWLAADEEITFEDVRQTRTFEERKGWAKLDFSRDQAYKDGYPYIWIDTCCIDKSSSAELAEAINSMYRWYKLAEVCYVYLESMPEPIVTKEEAREILQEHTDPNALEHSSPDFVPPRHSTQHEDNETFERIPLFPHGQQPIQVEQHEMEILESIPKVADEVPSQPQESVSWDWDDKHCKWFTRGWTLQEMLAPDVVQFYSKAWTLIGTLSDLAPKVNEITGIHIEALRRRWPIESYSIAQRMSWAASRETTKKEDEAYCLLGLFDVNLPIIYGEGERAFARLQEEILRVYSDQSIFAWLVVRSDHRKTRHVYARHHLAEPRRMDLLAKSPNDFQNCRDIIPTTRVGTELDFTYELTEKYIRFEVPSKHYSIRYNTFPALRKRRKADEMPSEMIMALKCCFQSDPTKLLTVVVTKAQPSATTYVLIDMGCDMIKSFLDWETVSSGTGPRQISVMRSAIEVRDHPPLQASRDTITCNVVADKYTWTWVWRRVIVAAYLSPASGMPAILWRASRLRASGLRASVSRAEPAGLWNPDSNSFFLPTEGVEFSSEQPFRGRVFITCQRDKRSWSFILNITASRSEDGWISDLAIARVPGTGLVVVPWTAFSQAAWTIDNQISIRPYFSDRVVVHQRLAYITVDCGKDDLICLCFFYFGLGLRLLFAFAVLPLAVAIPFVALSRVRQLSSEVSSGPSLSLAEIAGMISGLAFTSLFSGWIILDSKIYLNWKPRSWYQPMMLLLHAVGLVLSTTCLGVTARYPDNLISQSSNALNIKQVAMVLNFALHLLSLLFVACGPWNSILQPELPASRPWLAGRIAGMIIDMTLTSLVAIYSHRTSAVFRPWTAQACNTRAIPQAAATILNEYGMGFEDTCNSVARAASLTYALISLSFYRIVLDCIGTLQTIYSAPGTNREWNQRQNPLQRFATPCALRLRGALDAFFANKSS